MTFDEKMDTFKGILDKKIRDEIKKWHKKDREDFINKLKRKLFGEEI